MKENMGVKVRHTRNSGERRDQGVCDWFIGTHSMLPSMNHSPAPAFPSPPWFPPSPNVKYPLPLCLGHAQTTSGGCLDEYRSSHTEQKHKEMFCQDLHNFQSASRVVTETYGPRADVTLAWVVGLQTPKSVK